MLRLKKASTVLVTYFFVEYIISAIIDSTISFNISYSNYGLFSFFYVLNKQQLVKVINSIINIIIDFIMIGYLTNYDFCGLKNTIFSSFKFKKTWKYGLFYFICLIIGLFNFNLLSVIPVVINKFLSIINSYYLIKAIRLMIFTPIIEEIIYRGIIFGSLRKYGFIKSLVISALIFGIAHYGFENSIVNAQVVTLDFLLGLLLAYIYEKTDQLCWPMAMHSFINLAVTIKKCS